MASVNAKECLISLILRRGKLESKGLVGYLAALRTRTSYFSCSWSSSSFIPKGTTDRAYNRCYTCIILARLIALIIGKLSSLISKAKIIYMLSVILQHPKTSWIESHFMANPEIKGPMLTCGSHNHWLVRFDFELVSYWVNLLSNDKRIS